MTSLRTTIEAAFVGMDSVRANASEPKIEAVIQANGGYIE